MPPYRAGYILMIGLLGISGCAGTSERAPMQPEIDLSPLDCGYKWFQSGYSPTLEIACDADRSHLIASQKKLASVHARDVAGTRCPQSCPPAELTDPGDPGDKFPDGVCNAGFVYFTTRLFFQCAHP